MGVPPTIQDPFVLTKFEVLYIGGFYEGGPRRVVVFVLAVTASVAGGTTGGLPRHLYH